MGVFAFMNGRKKLTPGEMAKERLKVAFVADNPGAWMLHCHIIEHQETGMMGYVEVA